MTHARLSAYSVACSAKIAACRMPMVAARSLRYSSTIDTGSCDWDPAMNFQLGLRTLAVLALVAVTTVVIVKPDLIGGTQVLQPAFNTVLVVGHA